MPYPVTPADVAARWRPLDAAETDVATILLGDAEVLLDAKRPGLAEATALPATDPAHVPMRLVVIVLADMVQRVLRNPDVQTSMSLSSDGSVAQSFPGAVANAARPRLEVTAYDLAQLEPAPVPTGQPSTRIYSVPYGDL